MGLKNPIGKRFILVIGLIILFIFTSLRNETKKTTQILTNEEQMMILSLSHDKSFIKDSSVHSVINYLDALIIKEIDFYIKSNSIHSRVSGKTIWHLSKKYDIDPSFILAQGLLESHYGTKGKASYTNSVFNVGAYDDGRIVNTYKHPNYSIEPYIKLLKEQYLVNGQTIHSLMKKSSFKNINGKRYASEPNYEIMLYNVYKSIKDTTNIDNCIQVYNLIKQKYERSNTRKI